MFLKPVNKKCAKTLFAFFFIAALFFHFIWLVPLMTDNYVFSRELVPGYVWYFLGSDVTSQPLSVAGAFRQACTMYTSWCGRFAGNLVVYLFFLLPHWLYCLIAAFGFAVYVWLLQMCVFGHAWRKYLTPGWILGLAGLVWLSLPAFGEAFFWLSVGGQWALLGQAACLLPFRFALDGTGKNTRKYILCFYCVLFFVGGVLVASLDYAASAALPPTAVACVLWLWWKKRPRKIPLLQICGALGLCLGAWLTLTAPGNMERARLTTDIKVNAWQSLDWPERFVDWLSHLPGAAFMEVVPLGLMLWGLVTLYSVYGHNFWRRISPAALLFIGPAILVILSYMFTAWPPPRAFNGCTALLLIGACIMACDAIQSIQGQWTATFKILRAFFCTVCVFSIICTGLKFYEFNKITCQREAILASGVKEVSLPKMPPESGGKYWALGKNLSDFSEDPDFWVNRGAALYYGLERVKLAPGKELVWRNIGDSILFTIKNKRIYAECPDGKNAPEEIYVYYWGRAALLTRLPYFMDNWIFDWLSASSPDGLKNLLIPLLLTRADIILKRDKNGEASGVSEPILLFSDKMLWLVRPGASKYALEVEPLQEIK